MTNFIISNLTQFTINYKPNFSQTKIYFKLYHETGHLLHLLWFLQGQGHSRSSLNMYSYIRAIFGVFGMNLYLIPYLYFDMKSNYFKKQKLQQG